MDVCLVEKIRVDVFTFILQKMLWVKFDVMTSSFLFLFLLHAFLLVSTPNVGVVGVNNDRCSGQWNKKRVVISYVGNTQIRQQMVRTNYDFVMHCTSLVKCYIGSNLFFIWICYDHSCTFLAVLLVHVICATYFNQ